MFCVLVQMTPKFPVNPYYEPLAWFMIYGSSLKLLTYIRTYTYPHTQVFYEETDFEESPRGKYYVGLDPFCNPVASVNILHSVVSVAHS